jgi:hypothetical protein
MGPKDVLGVAAFIAGCLFMLQVRKHDKAARSQLAPDAPEDALLVAPLYLFRPELFTEQGDRHRAAAVKGLLWAMLSMVVAFVVAAL